MTPQIKEATPPRTTIPPGGAYARWGKPMVDRLAALLLLALTAPVGAAAALALWASGQPVLFRQQRPGRQERLFWLHKFCTMRPDPTGALPDAERLTPLGRWLRRTSLDEWPQLLNVLRGEMSLVGPRPLLPAYLPLYTPTERVRHAVRPGVTGLAQVMGRNTLPWAQRFRYDVFYVEHLSWRFDLWILARTLRRVVSGAGVSAPGHATAERFNRPLP